MVSTKLIAAIKEKRNQEEIMSVLNEIPDDDSDQMNSLKVSICILHHISAQFYFIKCNFVFFSNECPSLCQHRPGHSFHIAKLGSFNYISQAFVVHIFKF